MTTKANTEPKIEGFIMPPEWLRPMPEAKLKDVCFEAMMQTMVQFQDFETGARHAMNAVANLLNRHGYQFETYGEISIFLGLLLPTKHVH